MLALLSAVAPLSFSPPVNDDSCPKVKTIGTLNFNLTEWTRKTWFIQEQQVVQYQQPEDFYCVAATYDLHGGDKVPFFKGTVISVYNYANVGEVNGPLQNANNMTLCGRAANEKDSSKLLVAPCFLPNILAGPYWVIGVGEASDGTYDWAVVIGGEPSVKWDDGCTTKEEGTNGAGLWLFTRDPVASPAAIKKMHQVLEDQGIARSRLYKVQQKGCDYHGARLK